MTYTRQFRFEMKLSHGKLETYIVSTIPWFKAEEFGRQPTSDSRRVRIWKISETTHKTVAISVYEYCEPGWISVSSDLSTVTVQSQCQDIFSKWSTVHIMWFLGKIFESAVADNWPVCKSVDNSATSVADCIQKLSNVILTIVFHWV